MASGAPSTPLCQTSTKDIASGANSGELRALALFRRRRHPIVILSPSSPVPLSCGPIPKRRLALLSDKAEHGHVSVTYVTDTLAPPVITNTTHSAW